MLQPVPGPWPSDLALTPLHLPSQPLGSTSVSPARLSAPWGRKEALCSCFHFQPRAWHTVGARGGLLVDQGSCVQLEAGHGVAQSGSLASSSDHRFVLQASESVSICVFSRRGPERGEEGQRHGELGSGAVQGLDRGQDGVGATGPGQRVWGRMPRGSTAFPRWPCLPGNQASGRQADGSLQAEKLLAQSEFYSPQGPCTVPQADGSSHTRGLSFPSSQERGL